MNIPNSITLIRILLIPVFILVFYLPYKWTHFAAAGLFALGAITDWLDGYLARKLNQTSQFGAFLDPVADKLLVAVALVLLVQADPRAWLAITAAIIIGREIAVSALREFMAEMGQRSQVKVATVGKIKTMAQMSAIVLMLYRIPIRDVPIYEIGYALLVIAAGLTLWSMFIYMRAAWPSLKPGAENESRDPERVP
jgi:CDP-diacylglycerol--glycerol-3-phosphate 3-phosphatidyltransferase